MGQTISEPAGQSKKAKQMERREAFMQSKKHTIIPIFVPSFSFSAFAKNLNRAQDAFPNRMIDV